MKKLYLTMAWRLTLDGFARGTAFLLNILIARALGVRDFGKFGYAVSITQIFYIFTDLGIHLQMIREVGEFKTRDPSIWNEYFKLKIFLMILCAVLVSALAGFLWHWESPWLLIVMLVWMFSNSMLDFNQAVCNALGRLDMAQQGMILQRAASIVGVLIPLIFVRTLPGVVVGLAIGGACGMILSNHYFLKRSEGPFHWRPNFQAWKGILKRSIPNGIGVTFGAWYLRLGFVFLAWQTTSQVLGEYTAAFRILEVAYLVPAGVMGIGFPHLAESFGLGKRIFVVEIKRIALVMVGLALLWTSFLVLGGPLIIRLLFGARYEGAAPVLRYLGFAGGMVFLNFFVCHLMIVINRQKRHAFHEVLVFLICATLSIVWIPVHGAEGAAMALLGTEVSLFLLTTTYLWRKWEHTFPNLDSANMPAL